MLFFVEYSLQVRSPLGILIYMHSILKCLTTKKCLLFFYVKSVTLDAVNYLIGINILRLLNITPYKIIRQSYKNQQRNLNVYVEKVMGIHLIITHIEKSAQHLLKPKI